MAGLSLPRAWCGLAFDQPTASLMRAIFGEARTQRFGKRMRTVVGASGVLSILNGA
jgi:hypothetical protein